MALPELTQKQVEKALSEFCDKRVPVHVRDKLKLNFSISDNTVLLFEERPAYNNPEKWLNLPVSKFKYTLSKKWHIYENTRQIKDFDNLLMIVDKDPTGIFWG